MGNRASLSVSAPLYFVGHVLSIEALERHRPPLRQRELAARSLVRPGLDPSSGHSDRRYRLDRFP